ncbi:Usher syndrome 2A (autosomal recessive, mild) [Echinococcus granulosus]|uniref:Usher syndrome 2A (Autosomal recessive, mild) n=1 Tax=Echinococcus granulosus TaxID=6210 RepID=W6UPR7_ECHGR|nr:Usher syndrome 2A (autosomal recessive, mild) [Echinococcus granulosus]EUB62776.1 Usher syndrome 2A (autosomal recessive, mild) [Echinococcus granulosus]
MTCFWEPPSGTPPAKYRVWINNNVATYLLREQEPSQLFVFIPSKDLQSDTPYSCLVEACSELGECSPRAQSAIIRSNKRRLPVPIGVRLIYESGGFLRCYWEHPVKVDIPLVYFRTFIYVGGQKKEIRPPTSAQKTAIDFINENVKPNREYSCEIMACYRENPDRLVCSDASSKSTMKTPFRPPSMPLDVKLTTPKPRTIQIAWRKPARAELPDHLLYEFVFKWIPQETEFLITFDPRKGKDGLLYQHNTTEDYQQVEVSITACSEGVEGIGGGCSEAVKVKGTTWPGRLESVKKPIAEIRNSHDLIVTWEVPKNPPGVMVNYTATFYDERHNVTMSCSVKHRDFVRTLSCMIKNITYMKEYGLSVVGCVAPNSDGNGGGCSPPTIRMYHQNMQERPLPPSNVSAVEIGAGQLEVTFQVDEALPENAAYFLVEAVVENRTVALCRTAPLTVAHFCVLEALNKSVNYTISVRSCNRVNDSMKELCSPPSDPVFASSRIGRLCAMEEGVGMKIEISTSVLVVMVICFFVYIILICTILRRATRGSRATRKEVGAEAMHHHENQSNASYGDAWRVCGLSPEKSLSVALLHLRCLQVSQICSQVKTAEQKRKLFNILLDCIAVICGVMTIIFITATHYTT